jgi:predicted nucleic acid-binding protein
MILVDSSVWVDHLRHGDQRLVTLLEASQVLTHPFVVGEIALGSLKNRETILGSLKGLPQAATATDEEVQKFIESIALFGLGIGYIDAHLLAAVRLDAGSQLWTRDKRLGAIANRMGLNAEQMQ